MVMMKQLKVGTEASDDRMERLVQPEGFSPTRLKVLVVDDDLLCLMILERMLCQCKYTVTTCNNATKALAMLRENRSYFDLVITDVYMPDMDGFKLLEAIGLELDLPVIMMSGDGETDVVMKGITHGACDYIIKPVRLEELRNIWQHVVRKRVTPRSIPKEESSGEWDDTPKSQETESEQTSRKRKENMDEENQFVDDVNNLKKARVVWSPELHKQFVTAVNQLGVDKAVPRRILEIMNVQGLTRENVASHLQKYRLYLKRLIGVTPQPYPVASFQACEGGNYGGIMQVQPGGRGLASSSNKGLSLGTVSMAGLGRGPAPQMDAVTLNTLMQLQNLQQQQQQQQQHQQQQQQQQQLQQHQQQHGAPLVHLSPSLVPPTPATPLGLQRMDSFDLDLLMKAQYDVSRQRSGSTANFTTSLNGSQESLYADTLGDEEDLKPFVGLIDTMTGSEPMTAMSMSNLRPREDVAGKSLSVARNYGPSKLGGDYLPTLPFSLSNATGSNTGVTRNNYISYDDHPIGPSFLPGSASDFLGQLHTYDQLDGDLNPLQGPHSKP